MNLWAQHSIKVKTVVYILFQASYEGAFSVWHVQGCMSGNPDDSLNSFKASSRALIGIKLLA